MIGHARNRAKEKGLEHSLKKEDLKFPKLCPVLGYPLKCNRGGSAAPDSPSIDRINNQKGYTKDNVNIISFEANTIKGSANSEKLYKVALYAEQCEGKGNRFTRWLKRMIIKLF